jgi:3-methyladenine DNA glycosylase/8-oxoguanine DNA glycosylase
VPELLGAQDSSEGFEAGHPLLERVHRQNPGLRMPRTRLVVEMLVAAVLEQKVTGLEARRAWRWLVRRHGSPAPGPAPVGMRVAPAAQGWARIPSWEWHRAGVDPRRSATVMAAVRVAPALERTLELGRGGPEVVALLCEVPGVGAWTAAEVVQRAHGDPDTVSVGDYHLSTLVGWALLGRPVDDDEMMAELAAWPGHRHRVVRLIEVGGPGKPRFGPRMTVQDHRAL